MANRAYLFASDQETYLLDSDWDRAEDCRYYDSRHTIPYGWFFFFDAVDIVTVNVVSGSSWWQETKFRAEKERAVANFRRRIPLIIDTFTFGFPADGLLTDFCSDVESLSGSYLLMDPEAIFRGGGWGTDEQIARRCREIVGAIADPTSSGADVRRAIGGGQFSIEDTMQYHRYVVG